MRARIARREIERKAEQQSGKDYGHAIMFGKPGRGSRSNRDRCKAGEDRIFPISYETARMIVAKAGKMVGVPLRPHDLRRYAATYASRSGVPIEIVSKVILRHSNLSTPGQLR